MASRPLPVLSSPGAERADAARNRRKIVAAAERLIAEHGIEQLSMDRLAAAAGVGKGTIFRRFGDRAALARALVDERERAFQDELIRGEPPLGPGAPAAERLSAFGHGFIDLLERHGELILAAESGGSPCARFHSPPYLLYRAHVATLLAELDPSLDDAYHSDALMAQLSAAQHRHWRRERELEPERIKAGWDATVAALAGR